MIFSIILTVIIVVAVFLLTAGTIPVKNTIENNTFTCKTLLGNKTIIDLTDAEFRDVPEDSYRNLIRTFGTSVGKRNSGNFKNYKTGSCFIFYQTGKGERKCFVKDGNVYVVDVEN